MPEIMDPPAPPPAAPAAAPSPSPSPAPAKSQAQAFDQTFLDSQDGPAPQPAPSPTPAAPKPGEPAPPKAAAPAQPAAPTPASTTLPEDLDAAPTSGKNSDFRKWGQRQADKAQKYAKEVSQLKERLGQLEASGPQQGQDAVALTQEVARLKKSNEEYEGELRLTKYERSSDFREKFEKPAQQATARAYAKVTQLFVLEPNPDDPDNPKERQASKADFDEVYGQASDGLAWKIAKQKFGEAAPQVMGHREKVRELWENAYAAVEEHKAKGGEREQAMNALTHQQQIARNGAWQKVNDTFAKKNPELFGERDGDQEGNELIAKAAAFVDTVFSSDRNNYTPEQQIAMDARARNWALAFPRMRRDNQKLKADLAEAQKTIETLRGSGPGKPVPGSEGGEKKPKTMDEAFDDMVPA